MPSTCSFRPWGQRQRSPTRVPMRSRRYPRFRPDLILADIGMPDMDGYALARQVRAQYPPEQLTLVAVTGWCADEDRRRVQEAGFDHHLVKPVGIATLKAVLSSKLSRATDDVA